MRPQQLLHLLLGLVLIGCGTKVTSVCRGQGACCALSGKTTSYMCERNEAACLAKTNEYPGTTAVYNFNVRDHKHTAAVTNGCPIEKQDVMFWADDPFEFDVRATPKADLPQTIKTTDGHIVSAEHPQYCRALCQTTDAELCPVMAMRSDVQLALLFNVARAAQNPPKETTVVPIAKLLAEFGVVESTNLCERGDLTLSPTNSLNIGSKQCRSEITSPTSVGELTAEVVSERVLEGLITASAAVAEYPEKARGFSININDPEYADDFSGPVTRIGVVNISNVFGQISGQNGPKCAALVPYQEAKYDFIKMSRYIEKDPRSVARFFQAVKTFRDEISKLGKDAKREVESIEVGEALFPYTHYFELLASIGKKYGSSVSIPPRIVGLPDAAPDFDQFLRVIDADLCSRSMAQTSAEDLIRLIPTYGEGSNIGEPFLLVREKIAAEILQCKFSAQKITTKAREVIDETIKGLK